MGKRIISGVNDLYTWCLENGDYGKKFIQEWTGITESGEIIDIHTTAPKSPKRVLFRCTKNREHEWYAKISSRNSFMSGCPYCKKELGHKGISLLDWCNTNSDFGRLIIEEWTGTDIDGKTIDIDKISSGSAHIIKFKCRYGHEWNAKIAARTYYKTTCPVCANHNASIREDKNLYDWCKNNGEIGKTIIDEWVGETCDNRVLDINKVAQGSNLRVKWRCIKGHEWEAPISSRTYCKSTCPYCSNKLASKENNLFVWCNNNNGIYGKHLLNEWTGLDSDNSRVSMQDLLPGTHKKVKWVCKKGHSWVCPVVDRTTHMRMCPKCNTTGTSYIEQFIYFALTQLYDSCENRYRAFKGYNDLYGNFKSTGIEYDISLLRDNIFIEYSPSYTHSDKVNVDKLKFKKCAENNIRFIYITDNYIFDSKYNTKECIKNGEPSSVLEALLKVLGKEDVEVDIERVLQNVIYKMYYK